MHPKLKSIHRAANIGLYGTLLLCILTVAEHFLDKYVWVREITTNEYTHHLFLVVGLILSVVDIAMVLFTMRRQIPKIRSIDDVDEKISRYTSLVRSVFYCTLFVVFLVCAFVVITHENTMIMLLLLLFVTLVLDYPNMFKIKSDLGLNNEQMKELFSNYS
ncbi:MAG: hypothetical protein J6X58_08135 [Bacteroidales bacterium]|nr:hypothetical protein [Bacteroidales bacterium]